MANTWYTTGTEIIFSCGGGILASITKAAEDNGGKVIGVDVDQVAESETIITSAMKSLRSSVYEAVKAAYAGNFPGGVTLRLGVKEGGVQLPDGPESFDRFKTFTRADYEAIFNKVKENTDGIADSIYNLDDLIAGEGLSVVEQMAGLEFENLTLDVIE
jgi:basic membrane protein A